MRTTFRSFAKINLHLQVVGRRADGYHELVTVFQTVDLSDLLTLELRGADVQLNVSEGDAPGGEENLAYQAAQGFLQRWAPAAGLRMDLKKRIPVGGGLGGGSSNAATVLLGLQRILGVPASREDLQELASQLGADVPYFLWGGTACGRGRGDQIEPLQDLEERAVLLVTPPIEISTAEVFGQLRTGKSAVGLANVEWGWARDSGWSGMDRGRNDLEQIVMTRFPVMRDVYNALVEAGATVVRLSGTGATLFAFFEDDTEPGGLAAEFPFGSRVVQARTLKRSSLDRLLVVG